LDALSVQTAPDGSRRMVWMIKRMIKQARQLDEPVGSSRSSRTTAPAP
jgi:hypothetical protein